MDIRLFPRWFYKAGEEPQLLESEEAAAALGPGWSDEPGAPAPAPAPPPAPDDDEEPEGEHRASRRR